MVTGSVLTAVTTMADDDDADYAIVGEFLSRLDKIDRLLLWDGNRIG